uniref:Peptidase S1 domain-containing protein n=1 Tax=Strongyloides stercoralis TaxID=6248 RepID=A0AAF5CQX9_STRER
MRLITVSIYFIIIPYVSGVWDKLNITPIDMRYYDEVNCGKSKYLYDLRKRFMESGSVFGHEAIDNAKLPWTVRIISRNKDEVCNGILVTQLHVLTNFGCIKDIEYVIQHRRNYQQYIGQYQVRIGESSSDDSCNANSDNIFNCSNKVTIRYIKKLHLKTPLLPYELKYGIIELNRPVTKKTHACIYDYQIKFLKLEEENRPKHLMSLIWWVDEKDPINKYELAVHYYKNIIDYSSSRFKKNCTCIQRINYLMVLEDNFDRNWKDVIKGAPLLRYIKDYQFGVYGLGQNECSKHYKDKTTFHPERFYVTFRQAELFFFDALNTVTVESNNIENSFVNYKYIYDNNTCGKVREVDKFSNFHNFENEVSYPWILTVMKGGNGCPGTLISKLHVLVTEECLYNILSERSTELTGVLVVQSKKYCTPWTRNTKIKLSGNESIYDCNNFDIQYREVISSYASVVFFFDSNSVVLLLKKPFEGVPHVCLYHDEIVGEKNKIDQRYLIYYETVLSDDKNEIVYLAHYILNEKSEKELGYKNGQIYVTDKNYKYICDKSSGGNIFVKTLENRHYLYEDQHDFSNCYKRRDPIYYDRIIHFLKYSFNLIPISSFDTSLFKYKLKKLKYYDYKNCGKSNIDLEVIYETLISGGFDVHDIKAIPWAVQIKSPRSSCSGVLISHRHVVTAAHCILNFGDHSYFYYDKEIIRNTKIIIGNYCNEEVDVDGECEYSKTVHRTGINRLLYDFEIGSRRHRNDIVVIELKVPVIGINHACLPFLHNRYKFDPKKKLITFGFGLTKSSKGLNYVKSHNRLKRFIYSNPNNIKNCTQPWVTINSTECLCIDVNVHKGLCGGDSGGGLIQKTFDNRYILIGINSRTTTCINSDHFYDVERPNIFIKIETYKNEILNFMHETKTYIKEK